MTLFLQHCPALRGPLTVLLEAVEVSEPSPNTAASGELADAPEVLVRAGDARTTGAWDDQG